jgi:hypothetical protein
MTTNLLAPVPSVGRFAQVASRGSYTNSFGCIAIAQESTALSCVFLVRALPMLSSIHSVSCPFTLRTVAIGLTNRLLEVVFSLVDHKGSVPFSRLTTKKGADPQSVWHLFFWLIRSGPH